MCANFGLTNSERTADNIRLKEILKRRALIGKQTFGLLTNSAGKRAVVLSIPSSLCVMLGGIVTSYRLQEINRFQ